MRVLIKKGYEVETDDLMPEQIRHLHDEVMDQVITIETQIREAQARRSETGEYADRDWYQSAHVALRKKRQTVQVLAREAKRRKREMNGLHRDLGHYFMEVARTRLQELVYDSILEDAKELCASSREVESD